MHTPEALGLDPQRWQQVLDLARTWCERDMLPALALLVGRSEGTTGVHLFGRHRPAADSPPLRDDAVFLVASITKPVVATGILMLIERGALTLGERVCHIVPEFGQQGKYGVTIRHLLTHTSGLPDMLPENRDLRAAQAPLASFVEGTCKVRCHFPPGRGVQYQSMGFAVLGEIIHRTTGQSCAGFLREELFLPLGMSDTALGAPQEWFSGSPPPVDRIAEIRVPPDQRDAVDWNWNSRYWRSLGAPWGGLLTTPADLASFARMMLRRGSLGPTSAPIAEHARGTRQLLSPAAVEAATRNQLAAMRGVPEEERRCRPWGLGWRLQWPAESANFGDLLGPNTYGHWGATGTVLWVDPDREAFAVILSTQPQERAPTGPQSGWSGSYLARLSGAIAAAIS